MIVRDERPADGAFIWMDITRCVAAVVVVLNHVRDLMLVDANAAGPIGLPAKMVYFLSGFGHQSVMVFFVLSGFWITGAVVRRDRNPLFWRSYMTDRLSRLLVVLIPALILGGMLDLIGSRWIAPSFYAPANGSHSMPDVAQTLSMASLLADLTFLQALVVPPFGSNGPLWSLAYEFWYYVWWPALWLLFRRRRASWALAALVLGYFFPLLAYGFACWLTGTALFFAFEACKARGLVGRRAIGIPLTLAAGAAFAAMLAYSRVAGDPTWTDLAIAILFAVVLFGLCLWSPRRIALLNPVASYGASSSFSLYSIHYPVAAFVIMLIVPRGRLSPSPGHIGLMIGVCALLVVVGWLFSKTTEANTDRVRARIRSLFASDGSETPKLAGQ